jgi:hypothetical protein
MRVKPTWSKSAVVVNVLVFAALLYYWSNWSLYEPPRVRYYQDNPVVVPAPPEPPPVPVLPRLSPPVAPPARPVFGQPDFTLRWRQGAWQLVASDGQSWFWRQEPLVVPWQNEEWFFLPLTAPEHAEPVVVAVPPTAQVTWWDRQTGTLVLHWVDGSSVRWSADGQVRRYPASQRMLVQIETERQ